MLGWPLGDVNNTHLIIQQFSSRSTWQKVSEFKCKVFQQLLPDSSPLPCPFWLFSSQPSLLVQPSSSTCLSPPWHNPLFPQLVHGTPSTRSAYANTSFSTQATWLLSALWSWKDIRGTAECMEVSPEVWHRVAHRGCPVCWPSDCLVRWVSRGRRRGNSPLTEYNSKDSSSHLKMNFHLWRLLQKLLIIKSNQIMARQRMYDKDWKGECKLNPERWGVFLGGSLLPPGNNTPLPHPVAPWPS